MGVERLGVAVPSVSGNGCGTCWLAIHVSQLLFRAEIWRAKMALKAVQGGALDSLVM